MRGENFFVHNFHRFCTTNVTVQESQPPTSQTGQIIYLFANGATTSSPTTWVAPTGNYNQRYTWGHFGITAEDSADTEFTNATKWVGNIINPRLIFSYGGPADGNTQGVGKIKVDYKIQISPLQPAGNDYTTTLRYIATPTY